MHQVYSSYVVSFATCFGTPHVLSSWSFHSYHNAAKWFVV